MQYAVVEYYNVKFYIIFKRDEDISKFWYLSNRIEAGEKLYMRDIYRWCVVHKIHVMSRFVYLKDIVSVFRMDGLSSKEHDIVMLRDRGRLILNGLGFFYYMYYLCKKHLRIRKYLRKL